MARQWTATFFVGLLVGVAGGLIGLGGAELRLPYLVGVLGLAAKRAVPVNLAVSLFTVLAALPVRLSVSGLSPLVEWSSVAGGLVVGAVVAAWLGAGWVRRISTATLSSLIAALLILLGLVMIAEAFVPLAPAGLFPAEPGTRFVIAVIFGCAIGVISSLLGVAGGEVIIPTLVVGFGVPVTPAGTMSLAISLPTILVGLVRHWLAGAFADRDLFRNVILPLSLGAVIGAPLGGLAAASAPSGLIKTLLGTLLVWSAWKVFRHHA
jgi:uncharacterized membrane protein YfcA